MFTEIDERARSAHELGDRRGANDLPAVRG